jgi:hypothetical protein
LQELLDASYTRAGSHLRSIWGEETRLDADAVSEELAGVQVLDLATVTPAGNRDDDAKEPSRRSLRALARSTADDCSAVYNAVVSLVLVQGAGPRKAVELSEPTLKQEFQRYLTAIPPGEYETQVSPGWAGMFRRPGIELAFTDHAGRNWIRYANGMLVQIKQAPASYYRLEEPVGWLQPEPLKSK